MRRSLLFIPSNNPAMLQNADVFDSDAVIFDLEDAVSPQEKDSARILLHSFLSSSPKLKCEVIVRINGLDTPFYEDDLKSIDYNKIDTIMLPKARVSDLKKLDDYLTKINDKKTGIIPIIELAISLLEVEEIVKCPRVSGVLLGAEDLTSDLEVTRTKQGTEIQYPRARIAFAACSYKIDSIDTPFTDTTDEEGLKKDILNAIGLGMNAKAAIHPNQVAAINQLLAPSEKQVDWANRVLLAKEEADKKGLGVFSLDGKMVDKPVYERAIKILNRSRIGGNK